MPPAEHFAAPPNWEWWILAYFFFGGISGGSYAIGTLLRLVGTPADQRAARIAFIASFVALLPCPLFLIADLGQPLRFINMLLDASGGGLSFKPWSPMSLGSWALLLFGFFAFLAFLGALAEDERWRWRGLARLRPPGLLGLVVAVLGGVLGFFVAGYTGVLLTVTNRPIWGDTTLLGLVFLISGASTAAALLALLGQRRAASSVHALERFDSIMLVLELVALIALVVSLGGVARLWLSVWGALLVLGVVVLGILIPLGLYRRSLRFGDASGVAAAALVLAGGFLLRVVIILSSEGA